MTDTDDIEMLIEAIGDYYYRVRERCYAVKALGRTGDPRAVEPLCKALEDKNYWFIRSIAADALGKIGDPRAVEPLCKALGDENSDVRQQAADALEKIGAPDVEPLFKALADPNSKVCQCADSDLINIGAPIVASLCKKLGSEDPQIRKRTAYVLRAIGSPDVLPRKLLLSTSMSRREKIISLNTLSSDGQYYQNDRFEHYCTLDARLYCEAMARDFDPAVQKAAEAILLDMNSEYVMPAQRDYAREKEELPRPVSAYQSEDTGEQLVRPSNKPEETPHQKPLFWNLLLSLTWLPWNRKNT